MTDPELSRDELAEIAPLLRRAVDLDAGGLARIRRAADRLTTFVRLPFDVLAARTLVLDQPAAPLDMAVRSAELLDWLDGARAEPPEPRDAQWRGSVPPASGWRRIDTVPDTEVRPLVRAGALALKDATAEQGPTAAQPLGEALLDSVVLTVADDGESVEITLRTLSAVTRLGFLARGSHIAVDIAGRWVRVAAAYGSVFTERRGLGLTLR